MVTYLFDNCKVLREKFGKNWIRKKLMCLEKVQHIVLHISYHKRKSVNKIKNNLQYLIVVFSLNSSFIYPLIINLNHKL